MKLLAIDTATEVCSVALLSNGEITTEYQETARDHSRLILAMIDRLMASAEMTPAQLDGLAFGRGPGSFTGVRIAAGVTQGIAFAADCPVLPVSDLAAIAQRAYRETGAKHVLTAIDARMGEVYWAAYQLAPSQLMQLCGSECVVSPGEVPLAELDCNVDWQGRGTGWVTYQQELAAATSMLNVSNHTHGLPHAQDILVHGQHLLANGGGLPAELAQPIYLRDKVAQTLVERGATR